MTKYTSRIINYFKLFTFLHAHNFPDFENWAYGRPEGASQYPEDIDPSLCTHIMYSFAVLDSTTLLLKPFDTKTDIEKSKKFVL